MRTIRPAWLVTVTVVLVVAGIVTTKLVTQASMALPILPLSSLATMGLIVVVCLILGLKVRRWRDGHRKKRLDPLLAARTLVLAQACAYAGAVLFGWHVGIFLDQIPTISLRTDLGVIWHVVAMMGGGIVMVATGLVVERFCKLPPEDNDGPADTKGKRESPGEEEFA